VAELENSWTVTSQIKWLRMVYWTAHCTATKYKNFIRLSNYCEDR